MKKNISRGKRQKNFKKGISAGTKIIGRLLAVEDQRPLVAQALDAYNGKKLVGTDIEVVIRKGTQGEDGAVPGELVVEIWRGADCHCKFWGKNVTVYDEARYEKD